MLLGILDERIIECIWRYFVLTNATAKVEQFMQAREKFHAVLPPFIMFAFWERTFMYQINRK